MISSSSITVTGVTIDTWLYCCRGILQITRRSAIRFQFCFLFPSLLLHIAVRYKFAPPDKPVPSYCTAHGEVLGWRAQRVVLGSRPASRRSAHRLESSPLPPTSNPRSLLSTQFHAYCLFSPLLNSPFCSSAPPFPHPNSSQINNPPLTAFSSVPAL